MATIKIEHENARKQLSKGFEITANAVGVTLGPKGRNVIISKMNGPEPQVTKDGVTVAREVHDSNPEIETGIRMITNVANASARIAGDGTSTATVIANAIVQQGISKADMRINTVLLSSGIRAGASVILKKLKKYSIPVEKNIQIKNVASVSANNDVEIGSLIAKAISKIGHNGVINIEESTNHESSVECINGMVIPKGFISNKFVTDVGRQRTVLLNPIYYITNKELKSSSDIKPFMDIALSIFREYKRPYVLIASEIKGEALAYLTLNNAKNILPGVVIRAPHFGDSRNDTLKNIAIRVGAVFFDYEIGNTEKDFYTEDFGGSDKIIVSAENAIITGANGKPSVVKKRIVELSERINTCKIDTEKERYRDQLAGMTGTIANLYVGAFSTIELSERRDRVDDAVRATHAAIKEGIIPGGGIGLYRAASEVLQDLDDGVVIKDVNGSAHDFLTGVRITCEAARVPFKTILKNAGENSELVASKIKPNDLKMGYNILTKKHCNMFNAGIIDPYMVARVAIEKACSVAAAVITSECLITEWDDNRDNGAPQLPPNLFS